MGVTKRNTKKVSQNNTVSEKTASAATKPSATNKRLSKILCILLLFPLFLALMIGGILLNYNLIVKNPKISVVMPVYNTAKYLPESISGVLDQTFKDFELIVVNDGSTDNSLAIIQEYAKKDKRIKVVNMDKNSGAAAARNEGIKHISGQYTLFVDSDDFMLPPMLEKMYNQAQLYNLDVVMALAWAVDEPSGDMFPISVIDRKLSFAYPFLQNKHINYFSYKQFPKIFFQLMRKYVWDKLIKTSVIKNNNLYFDNVQSHNDTYFITMALLHAKRIGYITDRVYLYRANRSGSVSKKNPDDMKSVYFTFVKIKQSLKDMNIYDELSASFLRWVGKFIPPEDWPLQTQEDYIYRQKLIELKYNSDDILAD